MRASYFASFFIVASLASTAAAQDADGDGIPDGRDLCDQTPAGAAIDPAGCASECDAQVIGEDAFARTLLTQVGLNRLGAFGTVGPAPMGEGYFPRPGGARRNLGFVANPERNGWTSYDGDFFYPGTPEEGFGLTVGGASSNNNTTGMTEQIPGAIVSADCVASGLAPGGRGGARVIWRGNHSSGLEIEQEVVLLNEGLFILFEIRIRNLGDADLTDVYYMRNVDPDNNSTDSCGAVTRNTIVRQRPPLGTGDRALVSAEQDPMTSPSCTNQTYLALAAREPTFAVVAHGGFSNRSAEAIYNGTAPLTNTLGEVRMADEAIALATRFDIRAGATVRFGYLYVLSDSGVDDALQALLEDADGDGVADVDDVDDDDDGIPDALEVSGFPGDPGDDQDGDGIPDWRDADHVPGGCASREVCDPLPAAIDFDGDGVPNHLDRDADGDGLTDARESGGVDDDGDGRPDGCAAVDATGACQTAGGASLLVASAADTDAMDGPDFLDLDADGDGIDDTVEAFDEDGDGSLSGTERVAAGADHDFDGVDDAFDADCDATLCDAAGSPVVAPLAAFQDADGDGVGDWLEGCGDAYVAGAEACDEGGATATCSAACLFGPGQPCEDNGQCGSLLCDADMTCATCSDGGDGEDPGCGPETPVCVEDGGRRCAVCADTGDDVDEGCDADRPDCVDDACQPRAPGEDAGPMTDAGAPDGGLDAGATAGRPAGSGISCDCAVARHPRGDAPPALWLLGLLGLCVWRRSVSR